MLGVRLKYETLRTLSSASIVAGYNAIGGPLLNPACIYKFVNESTEDVIISEDGIHNNDIVPAGSFVLYDCTSNACTGGGLYKPQGTQFYVSGTAGTGTVYLVVQYAQGANVA